MAKVRRWLEIACSFHSPNRRRSALALLWRFLYWFLRARCCRPSERSEDRERQESLHQYRGSLPPAETVDMMSKLDPVAAISGEIRECNVRGHKLGHDAGQIIPACEPSLYY